MLQVILEHVEDGHSPTILDPARKHGIEDDDMLHALRNPLRCWDMDDGLVMYLGPSQDGRLLEVGVVDSDEGPVVIHAMSARGKFLIRR